MTDEQVVSVADAFVRGCTVVAEGLCAVAAAIRPSADPGHVCSHPREFRVDLGSTMGHLHWRCECGYEHEERFGAEARGAA